MRLFSIGFIAIFILMLVIPLVSVDLSSDRKSVEENRMLANRPALGELKNHPAEFIRQFEAWFKDSTGFREKMIALYKAVGNKGRDRSVLYEDGPFTYVIGEQGHHFFAHTNGWMISKFQGKWRLPDEQLPLITEKLDKIKNYLDKRGIGFTVMFCTDKESVYPEYYPKSIVRGPEPDYLDTVTEYLKENTNVDVFNIWEALLAEKDTYLLYNKTDDPGHYNAIGGFFAYRELMRHMSMFFPEMAFYTFDVNDISISYDINERPAISLKQEVTYKKMDASFFDDVDINRPFTSENKAWKNSNSDQPVILFVCDSYSWQLEKYIPQHFSKTIFIHWFNMRYFEQYINKYKPDIVVFEFAEIILVELFFRVLFEIPSLSD
jgi:hypothetical protein